MNFILLEQQTDGTVINHSLETLQTVQSTPGSIYTLQEIESGKIPTGLILKRNGDHLEVVVDGKIVAVLDGFYAVDSNVAFSVDGTFTPTAVMLVESNSETTDDSAIVWYAEDADTAGIAAGDGITTGAFLLGAAAIGGVALALGSSGSSSGGYPKIPYEQLKSDYPTKVWTETGTSGNDTIGGYITTNVTTSVTTATGFSGMTINHNGGGGDDTIFFGVSKGINMGEDDFQNNTIVQSGGSGNDFLGVEVTMDSAGSITDNTIEQYGGSGSDTLEIHMKVFTTPSISADIGEDTFFQSGGTGDDLLSINLTANDIYSNDIDMLGGGGDDTLTLANYLTYDGIWLPSNDIYLDGGSGDDNIAVTFEMTGSQHNSEYTMFSNTISLTGGDGTDDIAFNFYGLTTTSSGEIYSNDFMLRGGTGDDSLALNFTVNNLNSNDFIFEGGEGADTITIDINANTSINNNFIFEYSGTSHFHDIIGGFTGSQDLSFDVGGTLVASRFSYDATDMKVYYDLNGGPTVSMTTVATFTSGMNIGTVSFV